MHVTIPGFGQVEAPEIVRESASVVGQGIGKAISAPLVAVTATTTAASVFVERLMMSGLYDSFMALRPIEYGPDCHRCAVEAHHQMARQAMRLEGGLLVVRENKLAEIAYRQLMVELQGNIVIAVPIEVVIVDLC
jgi:hypothetical protein